MIISQTPVVCFLQLRKISTIRRYITTEACETLIHALITSRLDYASSLLYGLPKPQIRRLQVVQNMAARVVKRVRKYDHITPVMYDLHWLPISQRIYFKILIVTFNIIHGLAPKYLEELVQLRTHSRCLRSMGNHYILCTPRFNTKSYGYRRFSVAAPTLWNKLPNHMRGITNYSSFKQKLKTYLFSTAY